jgi:hypothetical protein
MLTSKMSVSAALRAAAAFFLPRPALLYVQFMGTTLGVEWATNGWVPCGSCFLSFVIVNVALTRTRKC